MFMFISYLSTFPIYIRVISKRPNVRIALKSCLPLIDDCIDGGKKVYELAFTEILIVSLKNIFESLHNLFL